MKTWLVLEARGGHLGGESVGGPVHRAVGRRGQPAGAKGGGSLGSKQERWAPDRESGLDGLRGPCPG